MTITEFLEARIAEDEAAARAATPGPWVYSGNGYVQTVPEFDLHRFDIMPENVSRGLLLYEDAEHIARHDPSRVLAECAAKRAITKAHSNITVWPEGTGGAKYYTGSKEVCASCDERTQTPCATVRALAAVYSDHPDYNKDWAL